jgi:UDP-N-acetylglucosamine--N-acetylmuramyl-(pentapeptide) pyrophosphoryl-undecaprenol N-acetylglucosamine transferase
MHKILFTGGGSLGHITPSLAIWEEWQRQYTDSACLFVCAKRQDEQELLQKAGVPFVTTVSPRLRWNFFYTLCYGLWQNWRIIHTFSPDIVVSKGGYISVPTVMIAWVYGIPIVVHESDAVSGRANTFAHIFASSICYGLPRAQYSKKQVFTGNPVRKAMYSGSKEKGYAFTGLNAKKPILLVIGGSQGAQSINEAIWTMLDELLQYTQLIHITGRGKLRTQIQRDGYYATEFVTNELADIYAITSVALTRASAGNIAELQANTIPVILCPLRSVGHDHQQRNAVALERMGNARVVQQSQLLQQFIPLVRECLTAKSHQTVSKSAQQIVEKIVSVLAQYILRAK